MSFGEWRSEEKEIDWLGDADFWKGEEPEILIIFKERGPICGCESKVTSWRYVSETGEIEYNCSNKKCPVEAYSENDEFLGIFFIEFDESADDDDDDDGDKYALI